MTFRIYITPSSLSLLTTFVLLTLSFPTLPQRWPSISIYLCSSSFIFRFINVFSIVCIPLHLILLLCITAFMNELEQALYLYFYLPLCILNRKYNRYCFEDYFKLTIAYSMFEEVLVTSNNTFRLQQLRYHIKWL